MKKILVCICFIVTIFLHNDTDKKVYVNVYRLSEKGWQYCCAGGEIPPGESLKGTAYAGKFIVHFVNSFLEKVYSFSLEDSSKIIVSPNSIEELEKL